MYLVDTNIFLEALLEQQKASIVRSFFQTVGLEKLFLSDLSLHSIGIILFKLKKYDLFVSFLDDMIIDGITILLLKSEELRKVNEIARKFNLDFDDAYQYLVAEKYDLQLISFDRDFERTERKQKDPSLILNKI